MSLFKKYLQQVNESFSKEELNVLVDFNKIGTIKDKAFMRVWDDAFAAVDIKQQLFDYFSIDNFRKADYKRKIESQAASKWAFMSFKTKDENEISSVIDVLKNNKFVSFPAVKDDTLGFIIKKSSLDSFYALLEENNINIDKILKEDY